MCAMHSTHSLTRVILNSIMLFAKFEIAVTQDHQGPLCNTSRLNLLLICLYFPGIHIRRCYRSSDKRRCWCPLCICNISAPNPPKLLSSASAGDDWQVAGPPPAKGALPVVYRHSLSHQPFCRAHGHQENMDAIPCHPARPCCCTFLCRFGKIINCLFRFSCLSWSCLSKSSALQKFVMYIYFKSSFLLFFRKRFPLKAPIGFTLWTLSHTPAHIFKLHTSSSSKCNFFYYFHMKIFSPICGPCGINITWSRTIIIYSSNNLLFLLSDYVFIFASI